MYEHVLPPLELSSLSRALVASYTSDCHASSLASSANLSLPVSSRITSSLTSVAADHSSPSAANATPASSSLASVVAGHSIPSISPPPPPFPLPLSGSESSAWWSSDVNDADARAERLRVAVERLGPSKTPFWRGKIVQCAAKSWDAFYRVHGSNFFHDRGWLERDFPSLRRAANENYSLLEFGCGTGASFLPLLERLPKLFVTAFDFSARAITLARAHATYLANSHRACAFVGDGASVSGVAAAVAEAHVAVQPALINPPAGGFDAVLMLYMLSAMPTETHVRIFQNAADCLKPGGLLLLRDYGEGDEAQTRFGRGAKFCDDGSVMVRRDGTLAAFLRVEDMARAAASSGLEETGLDHLVAPGSLVTTPCEETDASRKAVPTAPFSGCSYLLRTYSNRASGEMLQRVWVHGVWRKPT